MKEEADALYKSTRPFMSLVFTEECCTSRLLLNFFSLSPLSLAITHCSCAMELLTANMGEKALKKALTRGQFKSSKAHTWHSASYKAHSSLPGSLLSYSHIQKSLRNFPPENPPRLFDVYFEALEFWGFTDNSRAQGSVC